MFEITDIFILNPQNLTGKTCSFPLNTIHMNICRLNSNFDEFFYLIQNCDTVFHITVLTETWITQNCPFNNTLNGYNVTNKPGNMIKCNGLCIFYIDNLDIQQLNLDLELANSVIIDLNLPSFRETMKIIAVYRSPASSIEHFLHGLNSCLEQFKYSKNCIFIGDTDINLKW